MASEIDRLLNKKSWTGEEVGKLLIASTIHDILHKRDKDFNPLLSQSDFDIIVESSLNTDKDYSDYALYETLYHGLVNAYNIAEAHRVQFNNGYCRYSIYLKDCAAAELTLQAAGLIPYIMTPEQYNKLKLQREATLRGFMESFGGLLFALLSHIMDSPEDAPEAVITAIEATKQEAVTNDRILDNYCKVYGMGYYQLPDGTRSDSLDDEDWQEKLKEEYLKTHKHYINGKQAGFEDTILHYNAERRLKCYMLFFDSIDTVKANCPWSISPEDEANLMKNLENNLILRNYDNNPVEKKKAPSHPYELKDRDFIVSDIGSGAEWHYYTEAPADITKYDIIAKSLCFYNGDESEDGKPQLKEFKADYPALYKALVAYIKKLVPQARDLKPTQYGKDFISWGELADLGVGRYPANCTADDVADILQTLEETDEDTTENFLKRQRIMINGIIIAQAPNAHQLDEKGEYIDNIKYILNVGSAISIDSIGKSDIQKTAIQAFRDNNILHALQYIYAFNALVKILGAIIDLGGLGLGDVKINTEDLERDLNTLNDQIYALYGSVRGTDADKQRKRAIIKEVFQPIDFKALKPTEKAIAAVTADLSRLDSSFETINKLRNFDALIERLRDRGL